MLPEGFEFATEFRDHSWMRDETWKMLKKHNVAYCAVNEPLLPPEVHITADFAYFRWHGRSLRPWYNYHYSEQELKEWVPKIKKTTDKVDKVYGYFNNHYHGYAVENCIDILEMLEASKPEHNKIKDRIIKHNIQRRPMMYKRKLDEFGIDLSTLTIEELLQKTTDNKRLERGIEIDDEETVIEELSSGMVKAKNKKIHGGNKP